MHLKCVQCQEIPLHCIHFLGPLEFLCNCFTFNCKIAPVLKYHVMEAYRMLWSYSSSGTSWSEWLVLQLICFNPLRDSRSTHCIGYWVGLHTAERKVFLLTGTIYSVSSHTCYTCYTSSWIEYSDYFYHYPWTASCLHMCLHLFMLPWTAWLCRWRHYNCWKCQSLGAH